MVLPEDLPLGENELLDLAMGRDQDQPGAGFEADPTLDAERGLADVDSSTDTELGRERPQSSDERRTVERSSIEGRGQPSLPPEGDLPGRGRVLGRIDQVLRGRRPGI